MWSLATLPPLDILHMTCSAVHRPRCQPSSLPFHGKPDGFEAQPIGSGLLVVAASDVSPTANLLCHDIMARHMQATSLPAGLHRWQRSPCVHQASHSILAPLGPSALRRFILISTCRATSSARPKGQALGCLLSPGPSLGMHTATTLETGRHRDAADLMTLVSHFS